MRRAAILSAVIVLAIAAVVLLRPYLTRERDLLSVTPQPPALNVLTLIDLRGGQKACLNPAVLDEHSEVARFRAGTYGKPAVPLRLTIRGAGYRQVAHVPAARWVDNETLQVAVAAPRHPVRAIVCVRNEGRRRIALYGARERSSRSTGTIDGQPLAANMNFQLAFAEREHHALAARLPVMLQRLTIFRPVPGWLLWPLAVLFVFGVPLGVLVALGLSFPGKR
jgi:hypothetical protein